jgi:hypothetical protein
MSHEGKKAVSVMKLRVQKSWELLMKQATITYNEELIHLS